MRIDMKLSLLMVCLMLTVSIANAQEDRIYKVAQVMPTVEMCKKAENPMDQRDCMQGFLMKHFEDNLKYPSEAEDAAMEGTVLIEFIIRKDGSMDSLIVKEDPGYGMGDAALKAVKKLKKEWIPGNNFGEPVNVRIVLPVTFELPEPEEDASESSSPPEPIVYMIADNMPRFAGCEDEDDRAARTCTRDKTIAFIQAELIYPEEAKEARIEGDVHADFIIDEEGNITDPKIVKGLSPACDEEVIRVLNAMPQWIPGEQAGKPVKVKQMLPFRFRLGTEE